MEAPEQNDLEKFIHAQLRQLPDREAPNELVTNVLAAIAKREKQPWWKQSFLHWPKGVQCVLFVALLSLFGAAAYGTAHATSQVQVPDVSEQISSYAWVWRTSRTIGETLLLAISGLPVQWLVGIGVVFLMLYAACIAAGFALFRVTSGAGSDA